jgi:hypothetical protein
MSTLRIGFIKMNIEFIPSSKEAELVVPRPKPAKNYIPDWYKNIPTPVRDGFEFNNNPGDVSNLNIKACIPFLDAYTHGYIQETWTDIHIKASEDGQTILDYNWAKGPNIIGHRKQSSKFEISNSYYDLELLWEEQWLPKLPKGYSVLYTSPLNRFDLPFRSLDAVIDADNYYHEYKGQYPFYINKNFSGVIPAGTPMYQIIPIKRSDWQSASIKFNEEENRKRNQEIRKYFFRAYKNLFWERKNFS